jgi:hypothetical protein
MSTNRELRAIQIMREDWAEYERQRDERTERFLKFLRELTINTTEPEIRDAEAS